jgi:hypothetical protein
LCCALGLLLLALAGCPSREASTGPERQESGLKAHGQVGKPNARAS